jgi:pimeloyl-ACP methyl ester carboxylesterase
MEWFVPAADGRTLAVEEAGDLDGRPVMVHVGTPNSRHLYGRTVADAAARGLRLISYDRPCYGNSTPQPGRTVADCAQDAQVTPWGFEVGQISVPVLLMHGRRDEAVPFSHGQWLAAHIPGVEARMFDYEGHGTLRENHIGEVHAWLAEHL